MKQKLLDAYHHRHACKDFDIDKKIDKETFDTILETGRLSPSSFGFEPWEFLVVQDEKVREELKTVAWGGQNQIPHASHLLVLLANKKAVMNPDGEYIQNIMRDVQQYDEELISPRTDKFRHFLKSDFAIYDDPELMFAWACRQTYIALGNMMTSAAILGVDSCPIEGFEAIPMEEVAVEHLGMDPDKQGVAVLCAFGYRIKEPRPKTRRPIDQVVRWV